MLVAALAFKSVRQLIIRGGELQCLAKMVSDGPDR
jgi:hypothetical protein